MKYIVFPSENLNAIPQEILDELHLTPRKSVDGTQVIMKIVHYEALFPSIMTLPLLDEEEKNGKSDLSLSYLRRRRVEYFIVRSGLVIK